MFKNTPFEFAQLGLSCLIQSAVKGDLYLQAPPSIDTDGLNLTVTNAPDSKAAASGLNLTIEWFIQPAEEKEFYYLVSAIDPKRERLLHLGENFVQNGDPVTLVEKNHSLENTKIRFESVPGLEDYFYISFWSTKTGTRSTDSRRCVYVDENTKQVMQWERTHSSSCYWRFMPVRLSPHDLTSPYDCFGIQNKGTGGFLSLRGGNIYNGTEIVPAPFSNQNNFKWRLKRASKEDAFFILTARDTHHDRAFQLHDSQDDGGKITLWELDPKEIQQKDPAACPSMVRFEAARDDGCSWCIAFCNTSKYLQLRQQELIQVTRKKNQQPDPNACWYLYRSMPSFVHPNA